MEKDQHSVQDSAEAYAVYVLQQTAEKLGVASSSTSHTRWKEFATYLDSCGLSYRTFERGLYGKYKTNVDRQLPRFVERLAKHYHSSLFEFENVERDMRNAGRKADFLVHVSSLKRALPVSLKNYIGAGGITRPQVSSGTYASFAAGFVFTRIGPGMYEDPRPDAPKPAFRGSTVATRNAVLRYMGRADLIEPLAILDGLQAEMREDLLSPDCRMYDRDRVRATVERIAAPGIAAVLRVFDLVGLDQVRRKFLARIGMDGVEEALFFDSDRYVDSITNPAYHELRAVLNRRSTSFVVAKHGQGIRFQFVDDSGHTTLSTNVPFTINTNGAWHRPLERYAGRRVLIDKGHRVELRWGERRPYKSREIATSTNTYIDMSELGIFGS
jgi:hypothetical protein